MSDREETDEALMCRAAAGDDVAFSRLVHRWERPLFGYLRRLLGNAADADDVFQETWLRVYKHGGRYRPSAPFRPWIYRIATNLCRDRLRWRRRHPAVSLDGLRGDDVAAGAGPVDRARERELEDRLAAALNELPLKQRTVFLMARYEGMAYDEIARTLRIPTGTVKSRMNKATGFLMDRLREFLP